MPPAMTNHIAAIDTGPGNPDALRESAFRRFYRGVQASGTGSGLGLAIAKRVVDRHGGSIMLASGEDGRDLRVSVRLPQIPSGAPT